MSWENWFQDVAGSVINKAADAKYSQPYEIDRLRLQALGELGNYNEGQPQSTAQAGRGGLTDGTLLLIGGIALLFILTQD